MTTGKGEDNGKVWGKTERRTGMGWKERIEGEGGSEWGARMVGRRGALGSNCKGEWCHLTTVMETFQLKSSNAPLRPSPPSAPIFPSLPLERSCFSFFSPLPPNLPTLEPPSRFYHSPSSPSLPSPPLRCPSHQEFLPRKHHLRHGHAHVPGH